MASRLRGGEADEGERGRNGTTGRAINRHDHTRRPKSTKTVGTESAGLVQVARRAESEGSQQIAQARSRTMRAPVWRAGRPRRRTGNPRSETRTTDGVLRRSGSATTRAQEGGLSSTRSATALSRMLPEPRPRSATPPMSRWTRCRAAGPGSGGPAGRGRRGRSPSSSSGCRRARRGTGRCGRRRRAGRRRWSLGDALGPRQLPELRDGGVVHPAGRRGPGPARRRTRDEAERDPRASGPRLPSPRHRSVG